MRLDRESRLTPIHVLERALQILQDGRDPKDLVPMEEAFIDVLQATLDVKYIEQNHDMRSPDRCRCDQCTSTIALAQAIIDQLEKQGRA
jgi:hypothetical protein